MQESPFDKYNVKREMWEGYVQGLVNLVCKVCTYGKVITFYKGDEDPTPWATWARALQLFGKPDGGWRIGFFAWDAPRILPEPGQPVGPEHVNGGYAYPCRPNTVIVYRMEEATRVLLHELFHAACCDRDLEIAQKEAETEAWAEWFLVALASRGNQKKAKELFDEQLKWMATSHATLRKFYGIYSPEQYVWRYTIGREEAYCRLGYTIPTSRIKNPKKSNRLTSPVFDKALGSL